MDDRTLRRYCTELIATLDLPEPFDINVLCDRLEADRDRPISLVSMPMPTGERRPCGLWLATAEEDYIAYPANTSRAHQQHIILHELGHVLLGHQTTEAVQDEVSRLLMPSLDPTIVRAVLGRTTYTTTEERAAEVFASLVSVQASEVTHRPVTDAPSHVATLVNHLGRSLEREGRS